MISTSEDDLVCDFAEFYHIYDFRALPVMLAATLACGLGENSRIKRRLAGCDYGTDTLLLAAAVDRLSLLWWAKTKDAQHGNGQPKSVLSALQNTQQSDNDVTAYRSGEDFEAARKRLLDEGR